MSLDLNTVLQLVTDLPPTSTTSRNLICQLANKVLLSIPKSSQVPADSKAMLATLSTQLESSGAKPDTIRLFTQHFGHSADVYLATALTKELSLELGPGRASTILNLANMELRRQQHEHAQVDANAVANQGLLATRTLPNTAQAPRIAACGPKPNNFPDRRAEHPLPPRPTQRMLP